MKTLRETGFTELMSLGSEAAYKFPLSKYDSAVRAWKSGEPFFEEIGWHGAKVTVKLSRIECITEWTPEALELLYAERREQEKQDAISGD